MGKLLFVTLILTLAIGTSSIAQANLLVNPNFETGDFSGWSAEYNSWNLGTVSANPQNGTYHGRVFNDAVAYQEVFITGEQQYRLTGYGNVPAGGQTEPWNSFIGLRMYNAVGGQVYTWEFNLKGLTRGVYNLADSDWVTAPATAVTARIRWGTWANSPWQPAAPTDFDNFDFTPIPEPTSLLLLGSGLVGLAAFARKRRI